MNKKIIVTAVVTIVVAGGVYLSTSSLPKTQPQMGGYDALKPEYRLENRGVSTQNTNNNTVVLTDSGYSPAVLTIKKGETVLFKNNSSESMWTASDMHPSHTAYSGTSADQHCPDTVGAAFDACKGYLPGQTWPFRFDKIGSWNYHNHLDAVQFGTIVVQ